MSTTSSKKSNQRRYSPRSFDFTRDYRNKRKKLGAVTSWAYQELLYKAIEAKNISDINKYIQLGVNPNRGRSKLDKSSAICKAITLNCLECIDAMASKCDFNFAYGSVDFLPIVMAARTSIHLMDYLFEKYSINVNAYSSMYNIEGKAFALTPIVIQSKPGAITWMLDKGANPMYGKYPPWLRYIKYCENAMIEETLAFIDKGVAIDMMVRGKAETTLLGITIEKKRYDIAKILLEKGANPNYCYSTVISVYAPLHWAIKHNNFEMVRLLVQKGANINAKDYWHCKPSGSALEFAMKEKADQKIVDYLLEKGAR